MRRFFLITITIIFLYSCYSNFNGPQDLPSYVFLSVGDKTQLINTNDSSTILFNIVSTRLRQDGKLVYEGTWKYGRSNQIDHFFYYVSDSFFIATEIDSTEDESYLLNNNPFIEQRLAKVNPQPNDTWVHIIGDVDPTYVHAKKVALFSTPAGHFEDVYGFEINTFLTTYYAAGVGWIGTTTGYSDSQFLCTYKEVSGISYGALWPEKDALPVFVNINASNKVFSEKLIYNIIGNKNTVIH